jgi:competence protein ComEC
MRFRRKHLFLYWTISVVIAIYFWINAFYNVQSSSGLLSVAFLDVGQGDAIFIETPNGKQVLIDSGAGPVIIESLARVMSPLDRSIDMALATHADMDHIGGFSSVIDGYELGVYADSGISGKTQTFDKLQAKIKEHNIPEIKLSAGDNIKIDEDVYLEILFPPKDVGVMDINDSSVVARLVYKDRSFMLMGDASLYTESLIKNRYKGIIESDVLKLGHHGSKTSSGDAWLSAVSPSYAIISAGLKNRYGHPHPEVVKRLSKNNIQSLGTYEKGDIVFQSDGVDVWVK